MSLSICARQASEHVTSGKRKVFAQKPRRLTASNFLAGCPELTSVVLPSTLTRINWYSFSGDYKLKTVTCKAATPPTIKASDHVFKNVLLASATLRVPAGSKALYQAAEGWKDFDTIEEF